MSTVKISELPNLPSISANTSNTLFLGVDIPTSVTGKFTATTLAQQLYANNYLVVGDYVVTYPNTIAMFAGTSNNYVQSIIENLATDGTADVVAQTEDSTDTAYYIDMGFAGSAYSNSSPYNSLSTSLYPLDGYLYVQGNTGHPGGNLVIGTTVAGTKINFIAGGSTQSNIAGYIDSTGIHSGTISSAANYANGAFVQANAAFLQANTPSHVANSASSYANGAFAQANAAFITANTPSHVANSAAIYANGAFIQANAAFIKANNALANTTGTFGGDLTVSGNISVLGTTSSTGPIATGNLIVNGTSSFSGNVTMNATTYLTGAVTVNSTMVLANSNFSPTEAALTITASGTTIAPSNDGYMIHISGKNGVPSRVVTDSYGANAYVVFAGRAARGTVTSPTALQANDVITRIASSGYGTTKYQTLGVGRIDFIAAENFTDANTGSRIEFYNCPVGSNTLSKIASFNGDSVNFTGAVIPQKGFVYTPNVHNTLTALTIDFARDSLIKFNVTADATITLSNYQYGKVIEVWITNSAAQNKVITHGCLANNSTSKATTFTIAATSCAHLKYFSIDGDQANVFVSIVA